MWGASLFKKQLSSLLGATIRTFQATEKEYELDGVKVKRIPLLKTKLHGAFSKKEMDSAYAKTLGFLHEQNFKPDVIISHWVNPQLEMMERLKNEFGCKTCYVAHLASIELDRIYTPERSQEIIDGIDLIGFRSVYIRDAFMQKFKYDRPTFQCYSGVPEKYIPEVPVERTFDNVRNFVFVGTLIKRKNPAEIVPALVKVYGKDKFNVSYIGKGSETANVERYAKELNVQDNVHLLGYIPRDEVVKQLQTNDVFVMISKSEAFGLVYLEAMAQGLITIASRKEGFDGIIEHGKNGFLCEAGNIDELANLIKEIWAMKPEELLEISRNAIKTAKWLTDKNAAKMYIENVEAIMRK
ncbi:MAG: glycosyltransferase family 4 protein, partial [Bacteroidales bacterium]|nr:glycosyltransferase family 4 protein [Bacteroidales bacterium]